MITSVLIALLLNLICWELRTDDHSQLLEAALTFSLGSRVLLCDSTGMQNGHETHTVEEATRTTLESVIGQIQFTIHSSVKLQEDFRVPLNRSGKANICRLHVSDVFTPAHFQHILPQHFLPFLHHSRRGHHLRALSTRRCTHTLQQPCLPPTSDTERL